MSLPSHISEPTSFQTRVFLLLPSDVRRRTYRLVSGVSTPVQKIWDVRGVLAIFNYHSHSPMTGWPITSAWPDSLEVSWLSIQSISWALSAFSSFFSFLSPSPEIYLPLLSNFDFPNHKHIAPLPSSNRGKSWIYCLVPDNLWRSLNSGHHVYYRLVGWLGFMAYQPL